MQRIIFNGERTEAHGIMMSESIESSHGILIFKANLWHEERVVRKMIFVCPATESLVV